MYPKLKLDSSNILCGTVYSVYIGLKKYLATVSITMFPNVIWQIIFRLRILTGSKRVCFGAEYNVVVFYLIK